MVDKQVDILIVGGGLIGATLMLSLEGLGFSTLLVESKPFKTKINPDFDARSLALSPASQRILNRLGVWDILQAYATPIHMIHVSDQKHFGMSRLHAHADNPLGYVVEMQYINQALQQRLPKKQLVAPATLKALDLVKNAATITTEQGEFTVTAKLIVAADGAESSVRQLSGLTAVTKHYHQQAIVTNIGLSQTHHNKAYERFTAFGPLALLPMQKQRMNLIWALPPAKADELIHLDETLFLKELQSTFGYRLGHFTKVGKRFSYPLKQVIMKQQAQWPLVFVGNAAHTLHPVAGQGFNLGLRDVAMLAQCIATKGLNPHMLEQYLQSRQHDQQIISGFTDGLIQLFTSRLPGVGVARSLGLVALDNIPALKNILARYARGFGGVIPDLVCDIALNTRSKS